MTAFRAIFAALIVLGCTVMSQACVIEALVPDADCCCESGVAKSERSDNSCAPCVTLETGANHSTFERFAAAMPAFVEDVMSSVVLQATLERADLVPIWRMESTAESPPIWRLVARTLAPVRGPSLA